LCMHRSGSSAVTLELPAALEATAVNLTRSRMCSPRRTLNDAEYQASFALCACARSHTPPRQMVTAQDLGIASTVDEHRGSGIGQSPRKRLADR
jgi:hypothetical protein